MGKTNQFIKAIGISTIALVSQTNFAAAENPSNLSQLNLGQSPDLTIKERQNKIAESKLPPSLKNNQLSNSDAVFLELTSGKVAQASESTSDATADIIKPAQESISNTEKLNPSSNPLSFPTQPEEVDVEGEKPITLEQAIELALKNNKQIEEARLRVGRAEDVLRENQAALFPTLDLGSGLTYSGQDTIFDSVSDEQIDEQIELGFPPELAEERLEADDTFVFNTQLGLNYTIYDGGRRGASIRGAQKQLRSSELDLEVVVEQARFETARDYYSLQDSDAQVKIEEAAVEDANQTLKDAQLLEKAGLGTRFDVLRAEVELAQAQQRLSSAIANQNISRRQLAETLSVAHDTDLSTADAIDEVGAWELSLPESIVQAFKNRAELEQFLLEREINEEQRTIALSAIRPAIGAAVNYSVGDDFESESNFGDTYEIGLNVQWQLFDGGAARAQARQAEKDIAIAETQFADQRNQIRFGVEQAFFGLESNQRNISTATKEVELAQESLRLARLRFQAGVGTQTDVIEAQTQLTTARGNLLSSIIDYNQSYTDLQRQVSNIPDNGLQDLP